MWGVSCPNDLFTLLCDAPLWTPHATACVGTHEERGRGSRDYLGLFFVAYGSLIQIY